MKTLLICLMLLAGIKSNGQQLKADTTSWGSIYLRESKKPAYTISFQKEGRVSAYNKPNSDTLYIVDTVLEFYNNKIRYIKIWNKVYPLKIN